MSVRTRRQGLESRNLIRYCYAATPDLPTPSIFRKVSENQALGPDVTAPNVGLNPTDDCEDSFLRVSVSRY